MLSYILDKTVNNPTALTAAAALCLSAAFLRASVPVISANTHLPFHCEGMEGQALVEHTARGLDMQLISTAGKPLYKSSGLYTSGQLMEVARRFCRGQITTLSLAEEIGEGGTYYSCKGHKNQSSSLTLINASQTKMVLGTKETIRSDSPLYVLRGEAVRYCIGS